MGLRKIVLTAAALAAGGAWAKGALLISFDDRNFDGCNGQRVRHD